MFGISNTYYGPIDSKLEPEKIPAWTSSFFDAMRGRKFSFLMIDAKDEDGKKVLTTSTERFCTRESCAGISGEDLKTMWAEYGDQFDGIVKDVSYFRQAYYLWKSSVRSGESDAWLCMAKDAKYLPMPLTKIEAAVLATWVPAKGWLTRCDGTGDGTFYYSYSIPGDLQGVAEERLRTLLNTLKHDRYTSFPTNISYEKVDEIYRHIWWEDLKETVKWPAVGIGSGLWIATAFAVVHHHYPAVLRLFSKGGAPGKTAAAVLATAGAVMTVSGPAGANEGSGHRGRFISGDDYLKESSYLGLFWRETMKLADIFTDGEVF